MAKQITRICKRQTSKLSTQIPIHENGVRIGSTIWKTIYTENIANVETGFLSGILERIRHTHTSPNKQEPRQWDRNAESGNMYIHEKYRKMYIHRNAGNM